MLAAKDRNHCRFVIILTSYLSIFSLRCCILPMVIIFVNIVIIGIILLLSMGSLMRGQRVFIYCIGAWHRAWCQSGMSAQDALAATVKVVVYRLLMQFRNQQL